MWTSSGDLWSDVLTNQGSGSSSRRARTSGAMKGLMTMATAGIPAQMFKTVLSSHLTWLLSFFFFLHKTWRLRELSSGRSSLPGPHRPGWKQGKVSVCVQDVLRLAEDTWSPAVDREGGAREVPRSVGPFKTCGGSAVSWGAVLGWRKASPRLPGSSPGSGAGLGSAGTCSQPPPGVVDQGYMYVLSLPPRLAFI